MRIAAYLDARVRERHTSSASLFVVTGCQCTLSRTLSRWAGNDPRYELSHTSRWAGGNPRVIPRGARRRARAAHWAGEKPTRSEEGREEREREGGIVCFFTGVPVCT